MFISDRREPTGKPQGPANMDCPQWKKPMCDVCHRCPLWMRISGTHPQTGEPMEKWDCALALQVLMQMDTARKVVGVVEATDSMRNELVVRADRAAAQRDLLEYRGNT